MSAHALGQKQPERDLILSPQHRLCLSSNIVERITGEHQALISAKDLLELDGFDVVEGDAPTTYYHVMTPVRPHLRGRPLDKIIARHQDHSRNFTH